MKRLLSLAVLVIVALVVYQAYQFGARRSAEKIARVEAEAATLRAQKDSIVAVTSLRDSLKVEIRAVADSLGSEAEELRSRVSEMEQDRARAQLDVWELRTANDVEEEFARVFPEFAPTMRVHQSAEAAALRATQSLGHPRRHAGRPDSRPDHQLNARSQ